MVRSARSGAWSARATWEGGQVPSPGDTLAARALRAAIVGVLILPPFITFYSIWLLLRLASYEGEVGNAAIRKGIGAFMINTAVLVAVIEFLRLFVW